MADGQYTKGNGTLIGGDGDDTLIGGAGGDKIEGRRGHDSLNGAAGNDTLYGEEGNDRLSGGTGNDQLEGGAGNDDLDGGTGNDTLLGDGGNDTMRAGGGNDFLYGGAGNDHLEGDAGDDTLRGAFGNDTVYGGAGDDVLSGGAGNDTLYGNDGDDWIESGQRIAGLVADINRFSYLTQIQYQTAQKYLGDLLLGGAGNDTLTGGEADDTLKGGIGDDWLEGRQGSDSLDGDAGNDTVYGEDGNDTLTGGTGDDWLSGDDGDDWLEGGLGDDTLHGALGDDTVYGGVGDDLLSGSDGNDTLHGNEGDDTVYGDNGADVLYGGEGHDQLHGGSGNDDLFGGTGDDRLIGDYGDDLLEGDLGDDTLEGALGDDTVYGNAGRDVLYGGDGNDALHGEDGDDALYGGDGADIIYGGAGNDQLRAGSGNDNLDGGAGDDVADGGLGEDVIQGQGGADTLYGDAGDDTLLGGAGNDLLQGGADDDALYGGAGSDIYLLMSNFGNDIIDDTGPTSDIDVIDIASDVDGVVVKLDTPGAGTVVSGASTARFSGIERIDLGGSDQTTIVLSDGFGVMQLADFRFRDDTLDLSGINLKGIQGLTQYNGDLYLRFGSDMIVFENRSIGDFILSGMLEQIGGQFDRSALMAAIDLQFQADTGLTAGSFDTSFVDDLSTEYSVNPAGDIVIEYMDAQGQPAQMTLQGVSFADLIAADTGDFLYDDGITVKEFVNAIPLFAATATPSIQDKKAFWLSYPQIEFEDKTEIFDLDDNGIADWTSDGLSVQRYIDDGGSTFAHHIKNAEVLVGTIHDDRVDIFGVDDFEYHALGGQDVITVQNSSGSLVLRQDKAQQSQSKAAGDADGFVLNLRQTTDPSLGVQELRIYGFDKNRDTIYVDEQNQGGLAFDPSGIAELVLEDDLVLRIYDHYDLA